MKNKIEVCIEDIIKDIDELMKDSDSELYQDLVELKDIFKDLKEEPLENFEKLKEE